MNECNKQESHISRKHHMIYISSNDGRHPITKTFTPLHYTSLNYTSLHFTTLLDTSLLSFKLHPNTLKVSLHITKCRLVNSYLRFGIVSFLRLHCLNSPRLRRP